MKRVEYPISKGYCKNWTVIEALRELIANALDASEDVDVSWADGQARIRDFGGGLTKRSLLVGFSSKGREQIGQFGEGLKIAALVLSRAGHSVAVASRETEIRFAVEYSHEYDEDVLVAYHGPSEASVDGTLVTVACPLDEFGEARNLFLRFRNDVRVPVKGDGGTSYILPDAPGKVYVMGVFVHQIDALFGYDLQAKGLVNRDRTVLNTEELKGAIGNVLERLEDEGLIKRLLAELSLVKNAYKVESAVYFRPTSRQVWTDLLPKAVGVKTCMQDSASNHWCILAAERGWRVLPSLGWNTNSVFRYLGMKDVAEILNSGVLREGLVLHSQLTVEEFDNLEIAKRIAWKEFAQLGRIRVYERLDADDQVLGRPLEDGMEIRRSVLASLEKTVEVVLHECCHHEEKDGKDCSVGFENQIMRRYARATMTLYCARKVA